MEKTMADFGSGLKDRYCGGYQPKSSRKGINKPPSRTRPMVSAVKPPPPLRLEFVFVKRE